MSVLLLTLKYIYLLAYLLIRQVSKYISMLVILAPLSSTWPHLNSDVGLENWEY